MRAHRPGGSVIVEAVNWMVVHLVAVAVLAGVGWVVQCVVYPAFRLVGAGDWARYHDAHLRGISRVVAVPWLAQGVSTAALLVVPGDRGAAAVLAALALVTVVTTVAGAVPVHGRLVAVPRAVDVTALLRANLARTLAWSAATAFAAALLLTR